MLILLGHLVISILDSQADFWTLGEGGIYHRLIREAAPTPQKPKNKEVGSLWGNAALPTVY